MSWWMRRVECAGLARWHFDVAGLLVFDANGEMYCALRSKERTGRDRLLQGSIEEAA